MEGINLVLRIINLCKANIVTIQTGNNHLPGTYLLAIFWHEQITFIEVF